MGEIATTITIGARFNGPPTTGNGGYVCGLVARHVGGAAEVTLWVAPPLEHPLSLVRGQPTGDEPTVRLWDGETLVGEARPTSPASVDVEPPMIVAPADAERASRGYRGFVHHAFPTCFVCGPDRPAGDGLGLFPGPVAPNGGSSAKGGPDGNGSSDGDGGPDPSSAQPPVAAAPWTPVAELADGDGLVRPEVVWAALDCPSYFGGVRPGTPAVLGRLAAHLRGPVRAGEPHVVMGWPLGTERRKHYAAAAVTDAGGEVVAVSSATWIEPREPVSDH